MAGKQKGPPAWTQQLMFIQEMAVGFAGVSSGMRNLSPFHVIRERKGTAITDGARWGTGIITGKHVFEVIWPIKKNRGLHSAIGVGIQSVPIEKQGKVSLPGFHSMSWGFDLSSRRALRGDKVINKFAPQFPDKFYMYLDMDSGNIGFGDDVSLKGAAADFYGWLCTGIPVNDQAMYVMVGSCLPLENIQVYYKGTASSMAGFDLCNPATQGLKVVSGGAPHDPAFPPDQAASYQEPKGAEGGAAKF